MGTLLVCTSSRLFHWMCPDPDPERQRMLRRQRLLQEAVIRRRPTPLPRRRFARAMAASAVGAQLMAQSAYGLQIGDPHAALKRVLGLEQHEPGIVHGVMHQYVSAFSLVVDSTELDAPPTQPNHCVFDTDSRPIGTDSRASACISDDPADFPHGYTLTNKKVKIFGGMFHGQVYQGVLRWHLQEDAGKIDLQDIPGSYFIPEGGMRLFSPQHWSRQRSAQGLEQKHYHANVKNSG